MPPLFPYDSDDVRNLALMGWKEARGQGTYGMQAVMRSCCNRVGKTGFPPTLHDCIYQKNAYSSMSRPSDLQYGLEPDSEDRSWEIAQIVAQNVLDGILSDPTSGAKYYANLKYVAQDSWFQLHIVEAPSLHPVTAVIGEHTFFA